MNPDVARKIDEIKRDREHGASWLSREAIATIKLAAEKSEATNAHDFLKDLETTAQRLIEARPSMVAITNLVARFIYQLSEKSEENLDPLRGFARSMGDKLIRDSEEATLKAASLASGVIKDGDRVMSCSYSSTICQLFRMAKDEGKRFHVVVAESRASEGKLYGEITARELRSLGISAEVILDSSIDNNMPRVARVMVGADTILRDGSLINGTPTCDVALAAKKANIPFYTVCETSKLDLRHLGCESQLAEGFDRVSPDLITGIITEARILKPDEVIRYMEEWTRSIESKES
jgi:translation initiation factor eIF-2B subunit delta